MLSESQIFKTRSLLFLEYFGISQFVFSLTFVVLKFFCLSSYKFLFRSSLKLKSYSLLNASNRVILFQMLILLKSLLPNLVPILTILFNLYRQTIQPKRFKVVLKSVSYYRTQNF
ncbi:hypothetical protein LEP1GSC188_3657 [Leptospira weilii serovar Topaz str. LT2116]|uniref:Transmembrane protein n=1 Tax=Leptospira weilii serovar Topaz str. LT2116 TaxID=1088540 RepID=M3FK48_9LEPT|nr:hypothetical protein LEP1GSC188_3657 [Leptospira weilii serovar Topaz str. LT2116]